MTKRGIKKKGVSLRPWILAEVPIGSIVEYDEKAWRGTVTSHRQMITGASVSDGDVDVHFGGDHVSAKKLADGSYKLLRDGVRYPCGVMGADYDVLTHMEKFKAAKSFASLIGSETSFTKEFSDDTLNVDAWLESAKQHKVLLSSTGQVKSVWNSNVEPDPDMTLQEMCDSSCVSNAYHYVLSKLGLLSKVRPDLALHSSDGHLK
jgi:hypothetical protein